MSEVPLNTIIISSNPHSPLPTRTYHQQSLFPFRSANRHPPQPRVWRTAAHSQFARARRKNRCPLGGSSSHRQRLESRVTKVYTRTNPSTYPLSIVIMKSQMTDLCGSWVFAKRLCKRFLVVSAIPHKQGSDGLPRTVSLQVLEEKRDELMRQVPPSRQPRGLWMVSGKSASIRMPLQRGGGICDILT